MLEKILCRFWAPILGPLRGLWGGIRTSGLFSKFRYGMYLHDPWISQNWLFTNFSDGTLPLNYLYFMSLISTHLCPLFYLLNLLFPCLYNISPLVILFAKFLHCITWLVLTIKLWPPSYYIAPGPFQSSLEWAECWALKTLFKATPWDHKYQAPRWLLTSSVVGFSILSLSYRYLASML